MLGENSQELRRFHVEAYCLKCRTKRDMKDEKSVTMKNGKPAVQGKCPVCGTTMYKIGAAAGAR
jgi:Zn finger protein HypA/HybF involved in hydrogenase expression